MTRALRALIIDDSADDCDRLIRELGREGYEVSIERTCSAAGLRAALDGQAWDIVVCDYDMAGLSGLAALEIFQARGLDAPFIFVSDVAGDDVAAAAVKAGARDYLMKGDLKRLVATITRELRDAALHRERGQTEARPKSAGGPAAPVPSDATKIDAAVLVVEDNADVRRLVCRLLRDFGCSVLEASSGAVALEFLQSDRRIDLIFSDVVMPGGISGIDLLDEARRLRPGIKTLLTTGFAEASLRNQAQFAGAGEILSKPYRRQDLARKVRSVLGLSA